MGSKYSKSTIERVLLTLNSISETISFRIDEGKDGLRQLTFDVQTLRKVLEEKNKRDASAMTRPLVSVICPALIIVRSV